MQVALAGLFVFALIALVAGPAMARRGAAPAPPALVAVVDSKDTAKAVPAVKLETLLKGVVRVELLTSKLDYKWRVSSLACSDVTVVALADSTGVVSSAAATSDPADPAGCVYAMKVPSGGAFSVYAQLATAQSVGITSHLKLDQTSKDARTAATVIKSDVVSEKLQRPGALKSSPQFIKIRDGGSADVLPLYFKLDPVAIVDVPTAPAPITATASPAPVGILQGKDSGKVLPSLKLDKLVSGVVRVEPQSSKLDLKWRVSSLACSDVTVVALVDGAIVSSTVATPDPADPAGCVYSLKVPAAAPLRVYAQLATAQSIGITSQVKLDQTKGAKTDVSVITSDVVTQKLQRPGTLKSSPELIKLRADGSSDALALYLKLDS